MQVLMPGSVTVSSITNDYWENPSDNVTVLNHKGTKLITLFKAPQNGMIYKKNEVLL